jgi:uracil-DNA glycosylase family 4
MRALDEQQRRVVACAACPRLVAWRSDVARDKRKAFAAETYWGRPVPGFGDPQARLLVLGLAPAAHGGNRTGRVFTGDRSGDWLYAALHRAGFANQPEATHREDGLRLTDAYVTVAVRCAPPDNKPTPEERDRCQPFLVEELRLLRRVRAIFCLGAFAWDAALRTLAALGHAPGKKPAFAHGAEASVGPYTLLGCYHVSQQNTFTGRLTVEMLDAVLRPGARRHRLMKLAWPASGPAVARLYQRLLALVFLDAFVSLGAQVHRLYGARGLIPAAQYLAEAREAGQTLAQFPSLFWLIGASDGALTFGIVAGVVVSLLAIAGVRPRVCFAVLTLLYISFVSIGHTFLYFQWDNLILECGAFAVLLSRTRRSWWAHTLFRLILFKLYWESGVAKWQSYLHDWQDGSAMTWYYETAPLPTWLAWFAHHLPAWWHHAESWATLAFELVLPIGIFGPRRVRLFVAAFLTAFQLVNLFTANYGFFVYLALPLHLFCLDDSDVLAARAWLRKKLRLPETAPPEEAPLLEGRRRVAMIVGASLVSALFVAISIIDALFAFTEPGPRLQKLEPLREAYDAFRLINTYHLFGHITRQRIEPQIETTTDGKTWVEQDLTWKAGDPHRRPRFIAPHQPRLDFQLWFHGNSPGRVPGYLLTLLDRVCHDPDAVDGFFAAPLPRKPQAVRVSYWEYHFSSWDEWKRGLWWTRTRLEGTRTLDCHRD